MHSRTMHSTLRAAAQHLVVTLMLLSPFGFASTPLTNLAHLDFLSDTITPPEQVGHTSYRMAEEPSLLVLWTYAEPTDAPEDRSAYRWVGGGDYDVGADTWGQGAYNTDDLTRAAIVYLRHWQQTGEVSSRASAYGLLRTVAYMQTTTPGTRRGNAVLWMQPDGTLNPSAEPVELPDPSDSDASYWLARTIWAFGEGYEAFVGDDPAFAAFLEERLLLALAALERQVFVNYPNTVSFHGYETPTWLINDGADSASEMVYGLSAYLRASGDPDSNQDVRRALHILAEGIALMSSETRTSWPFGATLPWAGSRSSWHGWGAQMAGALAVSSEVLGEPRFAELAQREASTFIPLLLSYGGADQSWSPTPSDQVQIAYGADAVLQNLLAVARVTDESSFKQLAGIAGAWYFGNNRAATPMYDPATGRTFDGLEPGGSVNQNAGAESTIHGLLSMLALDSDPELRQRANMVRVRHSPWQLLEAELGALTGNASVTEPESAWTGEALWSGGAYLELNRGGAFTLEAELESGRYAVMPVFLKQPVAQRAVGVAVSAASADLGTVWQGGAGDPGASLVQGLMTVERAPEPLEVTAGTAQLSFTYVGEGTPASLDAVMLRPELAELELRGPTDRVALVHSFSERRRVAVLTIPSSKANAYVYDQGGHLLEITEGLGGTIRVPLVAGGFGYIVGR